MSSGRGETLSPNDTGLELLENALATGAALVAIILALGSVSGAHLNPAVRCADALFGGLSRLQLVVYVAAQLVGAAVGVVVANLMFGLPAVTISAHARRSPNLWLGEIVATSGLLLVVFGITRAGRSAAGDFAVGAYITGAYFFTSSTSFVHPAVTLASTHNSARSQMAEGLLRAFGAERFDAFSAGTEATHVRPLAIRAIAELGIDITSQHSKSLDRYVDEPFDAVITVRDQANEACPVFFGARQRLHWSFLDPSQAQGTEEQQLAVFRQARDAIRERIQLELLTPAAG